MTGVVPPGCTVGWYLLVVLAKDAKRKVAETVAAMRIPSQLLLPRWELPRKKMMRFTKKKMYNQKNFDA